MEFITLGGLESLFNSIIDRSIKDEIASYYNLSLRFFCNYLTVVRKIRNACSHGECIYDFQLDRGILNGNATNQLNLSKVSYSNITGVLCILLYMCECISPDLKKNMLRKLNLIFEKIDNKSVKNIFLKNVEGILLY